MTEEIQEPGPSDAIKARGMPRGGRGGAMAAGFAFGFGVSLLMCKLNGFPFLAGLMAGVLNAIRVSGRDPERVRSEGKAMLHGGVFMALGLLVSSGGSLGWAGIGMLAGTFCAACASLIKGVFPAAAADAGQGAGTASMCCGRMMIGEPAVGPLPGS